MRQWTDSRYSYAATECFRTRYAIAAYHLRGCDHIIEIGGAKTRIDNFITPQTVTIVDPHITPDEFVKNGARVRHVRNFYQDHDFSDVLSFSGSKGLLLLGFAPKATYDVLGPNDDLESLKPILACMDVVVLETMNRRTPGYRNFMLAEELILTAGLIQSLQLNMTMVYDAGYERDPDTPESLFANERIYKLFTT